MTFQIYAHPPLANEAVKVGWSWPAFFFTWIWALTKQLWAQAIILFVVAFILGVLLASAGSAAPIVLFMGNIIAMFIFGAQGNEWWATNLLKLGYRNVGTVDSASAEAALKNSGFVTQATPPASSAFSQSMPFEDAFLALIQVEGIAKARSLLQEMQQRSPNAIPFQESSLNKYAYDHLKRGQLETAIDLFRLNSEAFPSSANCTASLADALRLKGETDEAIRHYKKAIEQLVTDSSRSEQFKKTLLANVRQHLDQLNPTA